MMNKESEGVPMSVISGIFIIGMLISVCNLFGFLTLTPSRIAAVGLGIVLLVTWPLLLRPFGVVVNGPGPSVGFLELALLAALAYCAGIFISYLWAYITVKVSKFLRLLTGRNK